jgi:hypothetical protein
MVRNDDILTLKSYPTRNGEMIFDFYNENGELEFDNNEITSGGTLKEFLGEIENDDGIKLIPIGHKKYKVHITDPDYQSKRQGSKQEQSAQTTMRRAPIKKSSFMDRIANVSGIAPRRR